MRDQLKIYVAPEIAERVRRISGYPVVSLTPRSNLGRVEIRTGHLIKSIQPKYREADGYNPSRS